MNGVQVVLFATTSAGTLKVRSDIGRIKNLLDAKRVAYEEVDLAMEPHRREAMLAGSGGLRSLPQLHVNGRCIGSADELQELEDWGELSPILHGLSPEEVAAAGAAAAAGLAPPAAEQQLAGAAAASASAAACAAGVTAAAAAAPSQEEASKAEPGLPPAPAHAEEVETEPTVQHPIEPAAGEAEVEREPTVQHPIEPAAGEAEEQAAVARQVAAAACAAALAAEAAAEAEAERERAAAAAGLAAAAVAAALAAADAEASRAAAEERLAAAVAAAFDPGALSAAQALPAGPLPEQATTAAAAGQQAAAAPASATGPPTPAQPPVHPPARSAAAAAAVAAIQASAADIIDRALRAAQRLESDAQTPRGGRDNGGTAPPAAAPRPSPSLVALQLAAAELPSPDADQAHLICSPIRLRPELPQLAGRR